MFDIAFSEMVVIAIVALIVIGPEKLPKVARTFGALAGRMQRYMAQIKEEVNREARFAELQKLQQEIQQASDNAQSHLQASAAGMEQGLAKSLKSGIVEPANDSTPNQTPMNTPVKD